MTKTGDKLDKSPEEWRKQLSEDEYRITRERGTERAFTGKYHATKDPGVYRCVCCGSELFTSRAKYDSGSGWPSFWAPLEKTAVELHDDTSHGMHRVEVTCARCDAHLGHVFEDGPAPTGQRYCINSAALELEAESKTDPAP